MERVPFREWDSFFLEAVLNLFRDRLSPMLKQIGVRDMQSGAQYGRNIPACNDNIISL